jgi:microcin C transport system substrate-binding protein
MIIKTKYIFIFACLFLINSFSIDKANSQTDLNSFEWLYGLTLGDNLKYKDNFSYFDYVNPEAPKGGKISQPAIGSFDTLNPFNLKGVAANGSYYIYDTLLKRSDDEPFSYYGLIAESVYHPDDYSYVVYKIRDNARWHDGIDITAEDIIWSMNTLKKYNPNYKYYYNNVTQVEALDKKVVKFYFDQSGNRELPLITGQFPILPKHYWEESSRKFNETTLEFPLGSGPYSFKEVILNKKVVYQRNPDYWGKDLPINRGFNNFDEIIFEYFRDRQVQLEAFKANEIDIIFENSSKRWATGYNFPAKEDGKVILDVFKTKNVQGMQAFIFNLRKEKFKNVLVRRALNLAFDFEWLNSRLFYDQYKRIDSYFDNSELESQSLPIGEEYNVLLEVSNLVPDEVFNEEFRNVVGGSVQQTRKNLREAQILLKEAGYYINNGKLVNSITNKPLVIDFLISQMDMERIISQFQINLKSIGIESNIRLVDTTQYQKRLDQFDFDIIVANFPQSLSPGNEQRDYWGSEAAQVEGSRNLIGIKNEAVDTLIDKIIYSNSREELIANTKALDRVLKWNYYVIPHYYAAGIRLARWNKFNFSENIPDYNMNLFTWWSN